ncbi:hypothetical protein TGPRC2_287260 [Toxoplasma gondii TgCatPRC2]|uniref:Uncharacterized protein n=1 Tax=Toxoplasma gondii TgCatPRC2 TaxID=1130821 RepID=A0A151HHK2_TOXGO|nr:hypothetical protein TGPRC2_287260 [Toxoplasma gondii TgCatPRC2]
MNVLGDRSSADPPVPSPEPSCEASFPHESAVFPHVPGLGTYASHNGDQDASFLSVADTPENHLESCTGVTSPAPSADKTNRRKQACSNACTRLQGSIDRSSLPSPTHGDAPSPFCSWLASPSVQCGKNCGRIRGHCVHTNAETLPILDGQPEEIRAFLRLLFPFASALVSALVGQNNASEGEFSPFPSVAVIQLFGNAVSGPAGGSASTEGKRSSSRGFEALAPSGDNPVLRASSLMSELHQRFVHLVADSSFPRSSPMSGHTCGAEDEAAAPRDFHANRDHGDYSHCIFHHPTEHMRFLRETEFLCREVQEREFQLGSQTSGESSDESGTDSLSECGEAEGPAPKVQSYNLPGYSPGEVSVHPSGSGTFVDENDLESKKEGGGHRARAGSPREFHSSLACDTVPRKAKSPKAFRSTVQRLLLRQWRRKRRERQVLGRLSRAVSLCCALRSSPTAFSAFLLLILASPADYQDTFFQALASWWRLCDQAQSVGVAADALESAAASFATVSAMPGSPDEARDLLTQVASASCGGLSNTGDEEHAEGGPAARIVGDGSHGQELEHEERRVNLDPSVGEEDREREADKVTHVRCRCCRFTTLSWAECVEYVRGFLGSLIPFLLWIYTSRCLLPPHKLCVLHNFLAGFEVSCILSQPPQQQDGRGETGADPSRSEASLEAVESALRSPLFLSDPPDNLSGLEDFLLLLAAEPSTLGSRGASSAKKGSFIGSPVSPLASGPPLVSLGAAVAAPAPYAVLNISSSRGSDFGQLLVSSSAAVPTAASSTRSSLLNGALFPWTTADPTLDLARDTNLETQAGSAAYRTAAAVFSAQQQASEDFVKILTGRWQQSPQFQQTPTKADLDVQRMVDGRGIRGDSTGAAESKTEGDHNPAEGNRLCFSRDMQPPRTSYSSTHTSNGRNAVPGPALCCLRTDNDQEEKETGGASWVEGTLGTLEITELGGEEARIIGLDLPRDPEQRHESMTSQRPDDRDSNLVLFREAVGPPLSRVNTERQQDLLARCLATFSFYSDICASVEERVVEGFFVASGHGGADDGSCELQGPSNGGCGRSKFGAKGRSSSAYGRRTASGSETAGEKHGVDGGLLRVAAAASQREEDIFLSVQEHVDVVTAAFLSSISQYDAFEAISLHHALPQPILPLLYEMCEPPEGGSSPDEAVCGNPDLVATEAESQGVCSLSGSSAGCACGGCRQDAVDAAQDSGRNGKQSQCSGESEAARLRTSRIIEAALFGGVPRKSLSAVVSNFQSSAGNGLKKDSHLSADSQPGQPFTCLSTLWTMDEVLQQTVDPWSTGRVRMPVSESLMLQIASTLGRRLFSREQRTAAASVSAGCSFAWRSRVGGKGMRSANSAKSEKAWDPHDEHELGECREDRAWQDVVRPAIREQRLVVRDLFLGLKTKSRLSSAVASVSTGASLAVGVDACVQREPVSAINEGEQFNGEALSKSEILRLLLLHKTHHFSCACRSEGAWICQQLRILSSRHYAGVFGFLAGDAFLANEGEMEATQWENEDALPSWAWVSIREQLVRRHLICALQLAQHRSEAEMCFRSYWIFSALRSTMENTL